MIDNIKKSLILLSDLEYKKFSENLLPGVDNILGVRLPRLRKLAKDINNLDYKFFLNNNPYDTFEEQMLQGLVIGLIKDSDEAMMYTKGFVPIINNWSVCDSFCVSLKIVENNKESWWDYISGCFSYKEEYILRFAIVMVLIYFTDEYYFGKALTHVVGIKSDYYYTNMAIAWCLSQMYTKDKDLVIKVLKGSEVSDWVLHKTISKIIESNQVSNEDKDYIRALRKRIKGETYDRSFKS